MMQEQDHTKPAFTNCETRSPKTIECIRVDGGGDEGPAHVEVQYWWTVRHIEEASELTMVTSRNSGASYRNRVELQNGCQALAHANLFIPSTLNGSCLDGSGGINKDILEKNLDSAMDVYISRVDGAPCASTSIHLYKGRKSDTFQKENYLFKVFLRGTKEAKKELMETHPNLYAKFERVWGVRDMHLVKSYPLKYIFLLRCCYKNKCIHPRCAKDWPSEVRKWFADGPPLSFIPVPTPDPNRPFGHDSCKECKGKCSGHYMKPDKLWEHVVNGGEVAQARPPSDVILAAYQQHKCIPPRNVMEETAKKVLLPLEEVEMWFQHLQQTSENRARGAKKAAETRKRNAGKQPTGVKNRSSKSNRALQKKNAAEQSSEASTSSINDKESVCKECSMSEPPDKYIDDNSDISWIQCDGCDSWFHIACLGLPTVPSDTWLCYFCNEQW